jgi:proline iminopeptidase
MPTFRYRVLLVLLSIAIFSATLFGQTEPKGDYITVNGKRLWYRIEGRGAPLLLIPGGPGASHTYLWPGFSILSRDFRIIYYDPYGRGQSDRAANLAEYTFERDVDEIEGLRLALRLDKISVYGQSYGAMVAQAYALKYPDSLSHLILASPFHSAEMWQRGNNDTWNLELQNHIPETWARLQEMRRAGHLSCEKEYMQAQDEIPMTQSYYYDPSNAERTALDINLEVYCQLAGPDADVTLGGDMASLDFRPRLKEIKVPTLILAGRWDHLALPRFVFDYKELMPAARIEMFETSGHLQFIEEPVKHRLVVRDFLMH